MTTSLEIGSEIIQQVSNKLDNSHSVNTGLDGHAGIIHVAANVSENLSTIKLQPNQMITICLMVQNVPWPSDQACR